MSLATIIGECGAPIDSQLRSSKIQIAVSFSGFQNYSFESSGTWSVAETWELVDSDDLDGDGNFAIEWDTRKYYARPGSIVGLAEGEFILQQATCCCPCRWTPYFLDPDGVAGTPFRRNRVIPSTPSKPRLKRHTETTDPMGAVFTSDSNINLDFSISTDATGGPCSKLADGSEPDISWGELGARIFFTFKASNTSDLAMQTDYDNSLRTITKNDGGSDVVTTVHFSPGIIDAGRFSDVLRMRPCRNDQSYTYTVKDYSTSIEGSETDREAEFDLSMSFKLVGP